MSNSIKESHAHSGVEPLAPKKKGHFKRFWWVYVIALIVIIVIVVPVILLVAVPKIAQSKLDDAKLSIDGITVTNTQTGSLVMSINSTILADDSVHADIDGFEGTLYLADVDPPLAFTTITFPRTSSTSVQAVNVSQEIQVGDVGAFTTFNKALLSRESVKIKVRGDTHLKVKGIARKYAVVFQKTIELKGLNNFAGLSITEPKINLRPTKNFNGTVHIPNPSVLTLEIGNTTFINYFDGKEVGKVYIDNLVLVPGDNSFPTTADIEQEPILTALTAEPYCKLAGKLPFDLTGYSVVNHGQPLPYFADALAASNQSIVIDLSTAAQALGIPAACLPTRAGSE